MANGLQVRSTPVLEVPYLRGMDPINGPHQLAPLKLIQGGAGNSLQESSLAVASCSSACSPAVLASFFRDSAAESSSEMARS